MSQPKIETWLIVQSGARITADAHLTITHSISGAADVTLTAGTYKGFAAAAAQLETAIDAAFPGEAFTVTVTGDTIIISEADNFSLTWEDTELQGYFGYASTTYAGTNSYTSDTGPYGKITMTLAMDFEWGDRLLRKQTTRHDGVTSGILLVRHEMQRCTLMLTNTEAAHFVTVLRRMQYGIPARIWLDSTNASTFAWTLAAWTGGRDLALLDPSAELDLASWLNAPWATYRTVTIDCVEVT